jgi:plastocyanin domain-containing protein
MEPIARPRTRKVQTTRARDGGQEVLLGVDGGRRVERVAVGDDGLG